MNKSGILMLRAALVGTALGLLVGLTGVQGLLAFYGFWGSWMFLILLGALVGAVFAARREGGLVQTLLLGTGTGLGLYLTGARAASVLSPDEYWFPAILGGLTVVCLAPFFAMVLARWKTRSSTDRRDAAA